MKDKRILVTGGGGFIGAHLVRKLITLGADIRILSRKKITPWRLKEIENQVQLYQCDIACFEDLNRQFQNIQPDIIFHLAAYGVNSKDQDYHKAIKINVNGTINMMLAASKCTSCPRIIHIGTCAEYGNYKEAVKENTPLRPVSIYGSSKAAATLIAHQIAREKDMSLITLRPFGVFGEYEDRHKIFCHTIMTLLEGKDLELTSCVQGRDYSYVGDVVDAMILAAKSLHIKNDVFNIGSGNMYPLKYYIESIHNIIESKNKLLFGKLENRKNELWTPQPNIHKIQEVLGWKSQYELEESLKRTINWYKENYYHIEI